MFCYCSTPTRRLFLLWLVCACSLSCCRLAGAGQLQLWLPAEIYRLRVENVEYGRIEVSSDGGSTYSLIGRVVRPASASSDDAAALIGGQVLRSSGSAIVLAVGPRKAMRLRSAPRPVIAGAGGRSATRPSNSLEASAALTNIPANSGLFGALLPPVATTVRLFGGPDRLTDFPEAFSPAGSSPFVFVVVEAPATDKDGISRPPASDHLQADRETVRKRGALLAAAYRAGAVARARSDGRRVFTGTGFLRAHLPAREPDPIEAVTFLIDDDVVAARNTPPYEYAWDTTRVEDGEHVVEICALNGRGDCITSARALVVVHNAKAP